MKRLLSLRGLRAATTALSLLSVCVSRAQGQSCEFRLVDATPTGQPGNGNTLVGQTVSGDGRIVAFASTSSNLVPGDANGKRDVFVHDLWTDATELVSVASDGTQADDVSMVCDLSADGRYVVIKTWAKSLDPTDQDGKGDIYVRDRQLGTTEWISKPLTPVPSVYDAHSVASISDDGRYVAFSSNDDNLVPLDTNGYSDVFLHDRILGTSQIVSLSNSGEQGDLYSFDPLISADGNRVLFLSNAKNFHPSADPNAPWTNHLYYRDLDAGVTQAVDLDSNGNLPRGAIVGEYDMSPDGSTIIFHGDGWLTGQWHYAHILWREGLPGYETIEFPNGKPGWGQVLPKLSWDGRHVAFASGVDDWSPNPASSTNVFLHDTQLGVTSIVSSPGPGTVSSGSGRPSISHDGKVVTFITSSPVFTGLPTSNHDYAVARLCDVTPGLTFCFPSLSPVGCLPSLSGSGTPSATSGAGHDLAVDGVRNGEIGLFLYGTGGDQELPFGNGWLCLAGPLTRMAAQATGGSLPPAQDCSGALHVDFNAWVGTGTDATLASGATVYVQSWSRDPTHAIGSLLSDAAAFVLGP
jgi:Tol biopolymer transport system component